MSTKTIPSPVPVANPWTDQQAKEQVTTGGMKWYFGFFFLSGFCSILYELIWLRLAMAQFGVTTPMVSIVLSTFMAGLGLGSWAAGRVIRKFANRFNVPPLHFYAIAEILIGCAAVLVPLELVAGRWVLEHLGNSMSLSSSGYYIAAGVWIALSLVPWCACMGATIPLGMHAIRSDKRLESHRSFSFLYLANVLGAVAGTIIPLLLIELWGFTGTLQFGMAFNLLICFSAVWLASKQNPEGASAGASDESQSASSSLPFGQMLEDSNLWLLFATGLTSMGMEVVWTRQYTIYVGTLVYSFAAILGSYLVATFIGSVIYRWWSKNHSGNGSLIWMLVWLSALIPLLTADMRVPMARWLRVSFGVALFSGLLGFITPKLVDRFSDGEPNRAGTGYAVNVIGCILGPLVAGFLLLPYVNETTALTVLALPWLLVGAIFMLKRQPGTGKRASAASLVAATLILAISVSLVFFTRSYVNVIPNAQIRRDSTATVVAGGQGMGKRLWVNGMNMTILTPITKLMSALPLTHLNHPPQNALVICFGMGTTHRSMLSWGIDSTVVDLVPSVPELWPYFHADAPQLARSPHSHIVVDDGRRFLERTTGQYDVIVIDPPPPIGAAGSSLLYSKEFYVAAKKRLRPDGILAQWYPGGDKATTVAITQALKQSFPYIRIYGSMEGWGIHYLASRQPIPNRSAAELASRMPTAAVKDLVEWGPYRSAEDQLAATLKNELQPEWLIGLSPNTPAIEDDRPINEYSLLRGWHSSHNNLTIE